VRLRLTSFLSPQIAIIATHERTRIVQLTGAGGALMLFVSLTVENIIAGYDFTFCGISVRKIRGLSWVSKYRVRESLILGVAFLCSPALAAAESGAPSWPSWGMKVPLASF